METAAKILVVALLVGLLWYVLQPRYVFKIAIADGASRATKGEVPTAFLSEVGPICPEFGITNGWIGGVRRAECVSLDFSRNFPPGCRQRLRNVWALWSFAAI